MMEDLKQLYILIKLVCLAVLILLGVLWVAAQSNGAFGVDQTTLQAIAILTIVTIVMGPRSSK